MLKPNLNVVVMRFLSKLLFTKGYEIASLGQKVEGNLYPSEATRDEIATISLVKDFTMTPTIRIYALIKAVKYIVENDIEGSFVECGVWRGGSAMAIAKTLKDLGDTKREIFLYDTFSGMTPPEPKDFVIETGVTASELMNKTKIGDGRNIWALSKLDEVKNNLKLTNYPLSHFKFIEGDVCHTLNETIPDKIALLRLDTDFYESTSVELKKLYPLVSKKGVLIIDDYGDWNGSKQATDEYLTHFNLHPYMHVIDKAARLIII